MTPKKYAITLILLLGLFFAGNLVIWYGYNGQSFHGFDGHGDLLRLGNIRPAPSETEQQHDGKVCTRCQDYLTSGSTETFDFLTIGDSFSNDGGGEPYQGVLTQEYHAKVLNLRFEKYDVVSLCKMLSDLGYFDRLGTKVVILECVERNIQPIYGDHYLEFIPYTGDPFQTDFLQANPPTPTAAPTRRQLFPGYMVKTNALLLDTKRQLRNHPYRVSDTTDVVSLTSDVFTPKGREHSLIFYHEDLLYLQRPVNVEMVNANLNHLAAILREKGIRLVFLPAPDKFDVYYPQLPEEWNAQWPENPFFDEMLAAQKDYIFIDSKKLLRAAVANGEQDVYWSDDTHWSWKAHQILSAEIMRQLEAGD